MREKRIACMLLACMLLIGTVCVPAGAVEGRSTSPVSFQMGLLTPKATGSFNMSIPAKSKVLADAGFPLEADETVTIKASYSPFSASVDFGLVAPDGKFYYFNITDGSIDETIRVNESGNYTMQVRNNSSATVKVSGFVRY